MFSSPAAAGYTSARLVGNLIIASNSVHFYFIWLYIAIFTNATQTLIEKLHQFNHLPTNVHMLSTGQHADPIGHAV
jgi:hypothetical protein